MSGGSTHMGYTVAAALALGGAVAYYRSRDKQALLEGLGLGGVFVLSCGLLAIDKDVEGHALATVASATLAGVSASRFFKGGAESDVMLSFLGVMSLVYQSKKTLEWAMPAEL